MKVIPSIQKYMTFTPEAVSKDTTLPKALDIMRRDRIRHLPVYDQDKLVGVLTDRDIKLAASFSDGGSLTAEGVMTPDPYTVRPQASLDVVVAEMSEQKYGCAIVTQENGKLVGIFTATDGLRVLSEILKQNYRVSESTY